MKSILRNTIINAVSLFILTSFVSGIKISGGFSSYIIGGLIIHLSFLVLRPILGVISLPLNIISLGTFTFVINAIIFYIASRFIPNIEITAFSFPGISLSGFVIPPMSFNIFFAFIVIAFLQFTIVSLIKWLIK